MKTRVAQAFAKKSHPSYLDKNKRLWEWCDCCNSYVSEVMKDVRTH